MFFLVLLFLVLSVEFFYVGSRVLIRFCVLGKVRLIIFPCWKIIPMFLILLVSFGFRAFANLKLGDFF